MIAVPFVADSAQRKKEFTVISSRGMTVLRPTVIARIMVIRLTVVIFCVGALLVAANYKSFVAAEPQSPNLFSVR